ncbi:hypothetical protein CYLTODRAFT_395596 [Cylindrobasidium torrendii FP15055 ss-10]|uniref:Xylanolytic transcriptional activator regulatory domain-containing protein n=1 Tax=Cylindrobasidium torrendii FP15055 ss-10 TaxID=1314674 RepID=A0A0D7BDT3_9AGAR|nr:hypothetical protein CYLTODRAFT_395596 [Cylindrobasidium torrendii FP15055 ss-10]
MGHPKKCDRKFPCGSCKKRGCGDICPDGAIALLIHCRFILANTAELHDRISQLSERVRQLEDGLEEASRSDASTQPHPLLAPDLVCIKNTQQSQSLDIDAFHESMRAAANSTPQRNSEYTMEGPNFVPYGTMARPPDINIPSDIMHFSVGFPFPWYMDVTVRKRLRDCMPPRHETEALCDQACRNALWQYNLDPRETFLRNLIHHCYAPDIAEVQPRKLALLLIVLAIGSHVDLSRTIGTNILHGEAYHHLARACICEIPLMEEPDFDELHALFFFVWYHLVFSDNKKAVGYAWNLLGFVIKMAQGLGLHRAGSKGKSIPDEDDRRRAIFWELLNLDCRLSLSLGRPPSISLAHVDAKRPDYSSPNVPSDIVLYHDWKNGFFTDCLAQVLDCMTSLGSQSYARVLELDILVREYPVPPLLDTSASKHSTVRINMQRAFVSVSRVIAVLQLHRRCFTEAMNHTREILQFEHKYAPSVVATYMGASELISIVALLLDREPDLSCRFLSFWFNAFSAAVTLSLIISRSPLSPLAISALEDLDRVCDLFTRVQEVLPFCGKALPMLEKVATNSRNKHAEATRRSESRMHGHDGSLTMCMLPESFKGVHSSVTKYAQEMILTPVRMSPTLGNSALYSQSGHEGGYRGHSGHLQNAVYNESQMWLPEVYRFASAGVAPNEQFTTTPGLPGGLEVTRSSRVAQSDPSPFTPMDPRVGKHETVNLEHGEITVDLTDTSYMAWF